ncbi:MAG: ABC transporter substrate-binding protein [Gemmatimonas sp.]
MNSHIKSRPRWRAGLAVLALPALIAAASLGSSCQRTTTEPAPPEREVLIGGLFSLTGGWSTLGKAGRTSLELAIEDVNTYLAGNAAGIRFAAAIEDTKLDPDTALAKVQLLKARGVQLLIGPQSSAEVERLKPFVDANSVLLVSPSSTAGTLAIVGDNVFRFTPSDSLEGVAIAAMMWADGKRTIIPVWRDDPGNAGLERATRAAFTALGGTVLPGIKTTGEFSAIAARLSTQVQAATAQSESAKLGIYLPTFDTDAVALFEAACTDAVLGSVHWYGGDGTARAELLLRSAEAAEFATRVGYPNPIFGLEDGARDIWEPLAARIRARSSTEPDAFALAIYDAVWVVARGYVASGATLSIEQLKTAFTTAASTHYGATGWTALNNAGDRKYGDFDYWGIRMVNGAPQWTLVAKYETRTGRVVR